MKYFTKEFCERVCKQYCPDELRPSKKAAFFSEEYFRCLYNSRLKEWKEERARRQLKKERQEYPPEKEFFEYFLEKQEWVKYNLPSGLLSKIADLRVFALGKATREIISEIQFLESESRRLNTRVSNQYAAYRNEALKAFNYDIMDKWLHDQEVVDVECIEDCLYISLTYGPPYKVTDKIKFKNYTVIKQDADLKGAWWYVHEFYKEEDFYELHVMLNNKGKYIEFIISAEEIVFI